MTTQQIVSTENAEHTQERRFQEVPEYVLFRFEGALYLKTYPENGGIRLYDRVFRTFDADTPVQVPRNVTLRVSM